MNLLIDTTDALTGTSNAARKIVDPTVLGFSVDLAQAELADARALADSGDLVVVQVAGPESDTATILNDALLARDAIGRQACLAIPATPNGLEVSGILSEMGVAVCVTGVSDKVQAMTALAAGAALVEVDMAAAASFGAGLETIASLAALILSTEGAAQVVATSLTDPAQVDLVSRAGAAMISMPARMWAGLSAEMALAA